MSGGKGGSSTSSVEIPAYIQEAAMRNLTRAEDVSRMGYVPQYGPQVAALTPMEEAAAQNVAGAASAFGMAAPTGADIYGGMGAPTEYAGGIRGYSSVPLYEQSIKQLRKARPAQYKYMQSFFIDPVTGKRGSRVADPIDYSAYQAGIDRANRQAYGGGEGRGGSGGDALGPMPSASQRRQQDYNQFRSDYEVNAANAARDPYGQTYAPSSSRLDINDRSSFMPPSSDGDGGGGGGDGTVMCSAYCRMGYLPKEIWKLDRRYGVKMLRNDPTLIEGYHAWGQPLAAFIQQDTRLAKVARAAMWPIVKAWAEEMAHNMKPQEYKPNYFGKAIKFVGEPFSRFVGKIKPRYVNKEAF